MRGGLKTSGCGGEGLRHQMLSAFLPSKPLRFHLAAKLSTASLSTGTRGQITCPDSLCSCLVSTMYLDGKN